MAKAVAICTCEKCGKSFEKIKRDCRNRSEADNYIEYAKATYTICEDCYRQEKLNKEASEIGVQRPSFLGSEYWNEKIYGYGENKSIYINNKKIELTQEQVDELNAYLEAKEKKQEKKPQSEDYIIVSKPQETKEEKDTKKQKEDEKPEFIKGKYWNEKVYLEYDKRHIFLDNNRYELTNEETQQLYDWLNKWTGTHFKVKKWVGISIKYKLYKEKYSNYKSCDYNSRNKTIKVYVPEELVEEITRENEPKEEQKDKHYEEKSLFYEGHVDSLDISPDVIDVNSIVVEVPECLKN